MALLRSSWATVASSVLVALAVVAPSGQTAPWAAQSDRKVSRPFWNAVAWASADSAAFAVSESTASRTIRPVRRGNWAA